MLADTAGKLAGCAQVGTATIPTLWGSVSGLSVLTKGLAENASSRALALSVLHLELPSNFVSVPLATVSGAFEDTGQL
jgi:hypothetical protein